MAGPTSDAPSASILTKQSRASRPKVRTGCVNCKRRKVKCDEQKPWCQRCAKAKIECEGYGIFIAVRTQDYQQPQHKLPIPQATETFIFYRGLNALSQLTEYENVSYDFARQRTVTDLSTLQCANFWTSSVLAGCHSNPAILHAVLALGAAHRSFTLKRATESCHDTHSFSCVAYTHYGRAIKHLQTRLSTHDPNNYRIILIVCIILLSFDLLQQRYAGALLHLHHGRCILKLLYEPKASDAAQNLLYLPPKALSVDHELVYSFAQMDLQSTNFGSTKPQFCLVDDPGKDDSSDYSIPESFLSADDAGRYIMILMNDCYRLIGILPDVSQLNASNVRAVAHQGRLMGSLKRWEKAFHCSRLRPSTDVPPTDPDGRKAIILEIHHALITIKVAVCLDYPNEMVHDPLLPYYSIIVCQARRLLPNLPTFNLDMAIVQPLFNTAIHCRHPEIRRQAVDILHRSGREGLWDSRLTELAARDVIKCEEEHATYRHDEEVKLPADVRLENIIPAKSRIAATWMFFRDEEQTTLRLIHKRLKMTNFRPTSGFEADPFANDDNWEVIENVVPLTENER